MRLIDADNFDKTLEREYDKAINEQRHSFASALNTIRGYLLKAPTMPAIEAVPVSYINHCIRETCGPESVYLSRLLRRWEEQNG